MRSTQIEEGVHVLAGATASATDGGAVMLGLAALPPGEVEQYGAGYALAKLVKQEL